MQGCNRSETSSLIIPRNVLVFKSYTVKPGYCYYSVRGIVIVASSVKNDCLSRDENGMSMDMSGGLGDQNITTFDFLTLKNDILEVSHLSNSFWF